LPLTVLSVAYPFARVDADPVGGAEQVLSRLDRGLTAAGERSIVVAQQGSRVAGDLVEVPAVAGDVGEAARRRTHTAVRDAVAEALVRERPDVVHLHGIDFWAYLPAGAPAMVSLHLPLDWYPPSALAARPGVWLTPVSRAQLRRAPAGLQFAEPIENGVDVEAFLPARKAGFCLALGRICPEKGFHMALAAARTAGVPLLLAGAVFPYAEHRRYFEREIAPRLDGRRRWIGQVRGRAKRRLMARARCVVVPSLAPETSSLVAREALAAGTPVVAFRAGALVEVVEPGRTGVLVDAPEALPAAIVEAGRLDPEACRRAARDRFSAGPMVERYLAAYRRLAGGEALTLAA
jgi:glycosyltransferase involved in cell wall biosynthesis